MLNLSAATDDVKPVTHLFALDLSSKTGIKLLNEAIRYLVDAAIVNMPIMICSLHCFLLILALQHYADGWA